MGCPRARFHHAGFLRLAPALGVLGLLAVAPYMARRETAAASALLPLSAGCAYAWTGISSKLIADYLSSSTFGAALAWAGATGLLALFGLLSEMSALQRRPATRVAPVVFVVQIAVPVVLAPLVSGESWSSTPLGGLALVGFLTLVLAGAAALGRTAAVSGLVAAGADQLGDGHGTEPRVARRRSSESMVERQAAGGPSTLIWNHVSGLKGPDRAHPGRSRRRPAPVSRRRPVRAGIEWA